MTSKTPDSRLRPDLLHNGSFLHSSQFLADSSDDRWSSVLLGGWWCRWGERKPSLKRILTSLLSLFLSSRLLPFFFFCLRSKSFSICWSCFDLLSSSCNDELKNTSFDPTLTVKQCSEVTNLQIFNKSLKKVIFGRNYVHEWMISNINVFFMSIRMI